MLKGSSEYNQRQSKRKEQLPALPIKKTIKQPETKMYLPKQLLLQIPFNPKDHTQIFYRLVEKFASRLMVKLGWRVVELSPHQIDLSLYCLSILQEKIMFPFKFFASDEDEQTKKGNEIYKDIWIEWQIMEEANQQEGKGFEMSVYNICVKEVLPRLREFISRYMNWSYMISKEYEDTKVIQKFDQQVITPIQIILKDFRMIKNYIIPK